tara:strand:- start:127 stop:690 length:564 start_codon:yes stop_codon:yes gene_type:complete
MALTRLGPNNSSSISGINLTSQVTGTLPTGNGGTGATSFAPGKIGQVKTVEINRNAAETGSGSDGVLTTSTSYVDVAGLTLSITPSATSSKILLLYHAQVSNVDYESSTTYGSVRVLRDSTTVSESNRLNGYMKYNHDMWTMSILDTPSSTSSLTYKVQIASGSSNVSFACPHNVNECGITLMEVLA